MIRALLWKETRQHLTTFLVLGFGTLGLFVAGWALMGLDPGFTRFQQAQLMGGVLSALGIFTAVLAGALLTGTDNEEKTRPWIDSLPGSPWKRWGVQVVFALFMQGTMVFVWGMAWFVLYGQYLEKPEDWPWVVALEIFLVLSCLAWGQWGGMNAKTVFGGFGLGLAGWFAALLCLVLLMALTGFFIQLFFYLFRFFPLMVPWESILFGLYLPLGIVAPLALVAGDLSRTSVSLGTRKWAWPRMMARWAWLVQKCNTPITVAIVASGVLVGFLMPHSFLAWPIWSMIIGILAGLAVLHPDQDGEKSFAATMRSFSPFAFDLRFFLALILNVCLLFVPFLIPLIQSIANQVFFSSWFFSSNLESQNQILKLLWPGLGLLIPVGPWLFLWWACGLGAAVWTSLFFEKWIVSFVISFGLAALVSSIWVPSLWGGDLSTLWVLSPLVVFWANSRFLYRGFCSATLSNRVFANLAFLVLPLLLVTLSGLINRFAWLPGSTPPYDFDAIAAKLVNPNPRLVDEIRSHLPGNFDSNVVPFDQADKILSHPETPVALWTEEEKGFMNAGYPKVKEAFRKAWNIPDEIFSLFVAAHPGLASQREIDPSIGEPAYQANRLAQIRLQHALFETHLGKSGNIGPELSRTLYLAACSRHKSNARYFYSGMSLEIYSYDFLRYLFINEKLDKKEAESLATTLEAHRQRLAQIEPMTNEVGWVIATRSLDNLGIHYQGYFGPQIWDQMSGNTRMYIQIQNQALKAPWERERKRRLINYWFAPKTQFSFLAPTETNEVATAVPFWHLRFPFPQLQYPQDAETGLDDLQKSLRTHWELSRLGVAVKRYQLDKKEFPKKWEDLVPTYLASVPKDPFTGSDFLMRTVVAAPPTPPQPVPTPDPAVALGGESGPDAMGAPGGMGPAGMAMGTPDPTLVNYRQKDIQLKPGSLVIWSQGPDGISQGGVADGGGARRRPGQPPTQSDDILFFVTP